MDYFNQGNGQGSSRPDSRQNHAPEQANSPRRSAFPTFESLRAPSNIRIRRLPSTLSTTTTATHEDAPRPATAVPDTAETGRRRSLSAPQGLPSGPMTPGGTDLSRLNEPPPHLPAITEGGGSTPGYENRDHTRAQRHSARSATLSEGQPQAYVPAAHSLPHPMRARANTFAERTRSNRSSVHLRNEDPRADEYESDVIDLLDLIDPEVRTIGTLTNLQNSLFIPDLGGLVNRRPTYDLTSRYERVSSRPTTSDGDRKTRTRGNTRNSRYGDHSQRPNPTEPDHLELDELQGDIVNGSKRRLSIGSDLSDSRYAVLPHGVSLDGWSAEDVEELNDHVRHLLHSRREGFKRGWKGFRKYISRPLGLFVFIYATSVTLFGAAWVFALIGWIYVGNESRQQYIIDIIDNVLVALFALMGDGLAPFRAVDTYHMCFIAHYHHLTWRLRQEKKLPDLVDHNDLPDRHVDAAMLEDMIDKEETAEYSVLTLRQQKRLQYHQAKFSKSHTFYKAHETATHHAFPVKLLIAVVVLLDFHSIFQVALGTCTWSIDYHVRPQALTATILSCSITCNIVAGVLISVGDHKTRKKDVLERMFRQALTEEALKRMARTRDRGEIALTVDPDRVVSEELGDVVRDVTGKNTAAHELRSKSQPDVAETARQLSERGVAVRGNEAPPLPDAKVSSRSMPDITGGRNNASSSASSSR